MPQRKIPLFFKTAKSSHSAWNAAGSFEFAYNKPWDHFALRPYEKIGYIYGKEGRYTEKGANELDLAINQETLSLLRWTLPGLLETRPVPTKARAP